VEVRGGRVNIWSDGGLSGNAQGGCPIAFSQGEFAKAIKQAARDLSEFEEPLRHWLGLHAARYEGRVASQFRERFIVCAKSE
jgi:hypothetical protein